MELSPDDPSYLDMRNSILQANVAFNANNAATRNTIWTVFAHRGMGYFAGSIDSNDASPVADFSMPPAANAPKGTVSGTVIDVNSHAPVVGARVGLPGLDSGFTGDPGATTTATGSYAMPAAFAHAYPYLASVGGGYEPAMVKPFTLAAGAQVRNLQNKRGWALISGGGTVQSFTGPDFSDFGCGPFGAIDGGLGSGWGSIPGGTITLKLPAKVNVTDFGVDPGATCGDAATANTKGFSIATSTDGVSFATAVGGAFLQSQGGHINTVPVGTLGKTNVQYVRFTINSNYADPNGFADVSEIQVHGTQVGPMTVRIGGSTVVQYKKTTTFTSEGSKGPDGSPVVAQTWSRPGGPTTHAATYQVKSSKLGARIKITLAVRDFVGRTGTLTRRPSW